MKKFQVIIALTLFSFPVFSKVTLHQTFVNFGCSEKKDRICVSGDHVKDFTITLLDFKNENLCHGKIEKVEFYGDVATSFKRAFIKDLKGCHEKLENYTYAVRGDIKSFKILKLEKNWKKFNLPKKEIIDFLASNSNYYGYSDGIKNRYKMDMFKKVDSFSKSLRNKNDIRIIKSQFYMKKDLYANGAYMIEHNGKYIEISDLCSSEEYLSVFELDKSLYIKTYSHCCECGWQKHQFYKINTKNIEFVSQDWAGST